MFKKISIISLVFFFMLSLASCGLSEKSSEDIADKLVEGIMDKAAGDDADIDYKDGKVTVKGKDGEEVTVGETKWPAELAAAGKVPEFKTGNIISSLVTENTFMVAIEGVELKDFEEYVGIIKESFVNDPSEMSSGDFHTYSASSDLALIYVQYTTEDKTIAISTEILR